MVNRTERPHLSFLLVPGGPLCAGIRYVKKNREEHIELAEKFDLSRNYVILGTTADIFAAGTITPLMTAVQVGVYSKLIPFVYELMEKVL